MSRLDLTQGKIFKTLLIYSIPVILSSVVQLLFHTADIFILALTTDDFAVAAVGACGSLITLLVNLFAGFATGADVLAAKNAGANDANGIKRTTGTAITIGLSTGTLLMIIVPIFAKDLLLLAKCQAEVLDLATQYLTIYFLGMPIMMLYNFVAAILRALGDSVKPMLSIIISGVLNILLNLLFVAVFHLTVVGVALATLISSAISLILVLITLFRHESFRAFKIKDLKLHKTEFIEMIKIGVPTCLCSLFFYVANVIVASAINAMSPEAMTANAIAEPFDGVIYTIGCAIAIATASMVGQNLGAKRLDRIKQTINTSLIYTTTTSLVLGSLFVLFSDAFLSLMTEDEEIVALAKSRIVFLCLTYFITSIMEIYSFSLRALQRSKITMIVGGICGFGVRSAWVWFIYPFHKTLTFLFLCYTISAFIACVIYLFDYAKTIKRFEKIFNERIGS